MKYCVNSEGVNCLRSLSQALRNSTGYLKGLTSSLSDAVEERRDMLGPHFQSVMVAISNITVMIENAETPCEELANMLNETADAYLEIIEDDSFSASTDSEGNRRSSSDAGGSVNASASATSGGSPLSLPTFQTDDRNVVMGTGYSSYMDMYNNYDSYELSTQGYGFNDPPVIEVIDPAAVEGIDLHSDDMNVFWSHHNKSWDRYSALASKIPQVQSALNSGVSLDELINDPELGACASQYFNPANMPQVYKGDGYYEFISDGRHRILAARAHGLKMPVRIRGIRTRR